MIPLKIYIFQRTGGPSNKSWSFTAEDGSIWADGLSSEDAAYALAGRTVSGVWTAVYSAPTGRILRKRSKSGRKPSPLPDDQTTEKTAPAPVKTDPSSIPETASNTFTLTPQRILIPMLLEAVKEALTGVEARLNEAHGRYHVSDDEFEAVQALRRTKIEALKDLQHQIDTRPEL